MVSAVIDCNIFMAGLLSGHGASASVDVLNALRAGKFKLVVSVETIRELRRVLDVDAIVKNISGPQRISTIFARDRQDRFALPLHRPICHMP